MISLHQHEERTLIGRVSYLAALLAVAGCGAATRVDTPTVTAASAPVQASKTTLLATGSCRLVGGRADGRCTPGVTNPDVTPGNVHSTICVPGWTDQLQPTASYLTTLKIQQMRDYGETGSPTSYKEDHLLPLALGGAPKNPKNLFPQPAAKTTEKEELADQLHQAVCSGEMGLTAAQDKIRTDWTH